MRPHHDTLHNTPLIRKAGQEKHTEVSTLLYQKHLNYTTEGHKAKVKEEHLKNTLLYQRHLNQLHP